MFNRYFRTGLVKLSRRYGVTMTPHTPIKLVHKRIVDVAVEMTEHKTVRARIYWLDYKKRFNNPSRLGWKMR